MVDGQYDVRIAYELIEGTAHADCDLRLAHEREIGMHWFAQSDKYQRRCRVLAAVALALAGVIAWMGLSR